LRAAVATNPVEHAELTGGVHVLFGIDVSTGGIKLHRQVEPPKGDRIAHQQRSALTLLDGRVYIAYRGLGAVASVPGVGGVGGFVECASLVASVVPPRRAPRSPASSSHRM
jgi:hypothetical protein